VGATAKTTEANNSAALSEAAPVAGKKELKLLPVDEASQDQSFAKFRDRLLTAAKNRDIAFILSVLDPHILNSLGGSGGVKEFREQWNLDEGGGELWNTLVTVLENGGSFSEEEGNKQFCAPYVSSKWKDIYELLPKDSDTSDYQAIVNSNVDLRSGPDVNSALVATLSYDVVNVISNSESHERAVEGSYWVKIRTMTGTIGFVNSSNIRSPSDYNACFTKVGSQWLMMSLAAGD